MWKRREPRLPRVGDVSRSQLLWVIVSLPILLLAFAFGVVSLWEAFHGEPLFFQMWRSGDGFHVEWSTTPFGFIVAVIFQIVTLLFILGLFLYQLGQLARWLNMRWP